MLSLLRRHGRTLIFGGSLASGALAMAHTPKAADAQEVTCWAESCVNNTCVRVKIKCPTQIILE